MREVPGVGPVVARPLLADLPEWGHGAGKGIALLVGLAPLTRDSGAWHGTRAIWGGRRHMRAALYLAALVAVRRNPVLRPFSRPFSERLIAAGKPKKLAVTACMQKLLLLLLLLLHVRLRDHVAWQPILRT